MNKLEIINNALRACGLPLTATLNDGDWNALAVYDSANERTLRSHIWNFALCYSTLEETTPPPFGFAHAFILPPDCVRIADVRSIHQLSGPQGQWQRQGDLVLCNARPCNLRYITRSIPCESWPADYALAVSFLIASEIAALSADKMSIVPQLMQIHNVYLSQAQAADAQEASLILAPDASLIQARIASRRA